MKNISNIVENKNSLTAYLEDFHSSKRVEFETMFSEEDFDCGLTIFKSLMKRRISMPKIGKTSLRYWTSRGWNNEEAKEKRVKISMHKNTPMCIEFWMKRGFSEEESIYKIKSQRKSNVEYWLERGFNEEDSKLKMLQFQIENSNKFSLKLKTDDKFRESISKKQSNNLLYWLESGYSEQEAKIKLSERQSTFSYKKCVEKYGEENGKKIWEQRQTKWIESLSKSEYDGSKGKNSKSIEHFKEKYGDKWIENFIEKNFKKDKKLTQKLVNFRSYQEMIDFLIEKNYSFGEILLKINNTLIREIFSVSVKNLHEYLVYKTPFYNKNNTVDYYKLKFGDGWVEKFLEDNTFKDKDETRNLLEFETYKDSIDYMILNDYSLTEISLRIQSKILLRFYNCTKDDFLSYLTSLNIFKRTKYGNLRYYNSHLCRSDYEFEIARFLVENRIEYEYEKKYPNSKYKCDFYLKDYDCYVEYMGMFKKDDYVEKYNKKKNFCIQNNIKHIYSSNLQEIKKLIENEIQLNTKSTTNTTR